MKTTAVSPTDQQPSQHLLLSGALIPGSQSIGNAEVKSTSPPSQHFLQCLSVCDMSDSINISMLPLVLLQVPVMVLVLTCPQMKDKTRKWFMTFPFLVCLFLGLKKFLLNITITSLQHPSKLSGHFIGNTLCTSCDESSDYCTGCQAKMNTVWYLWY